MKLYRNIAFLFLIAITIFACQKAEEKEVVRDRTGTGVSATTDTANMLIGDWIHLELEAWAPKEKRVVWPIMADTVNSFEVIEATEIDTIKNEETGINVLTQTLTLTHFDTGYHIIKPIPFVIGTEDTLKTDPVMIAVNSVEVDTTGQIADIKDPMNVPFTPEELLPYVPYILGGLAILGIIAAIIIFYLIKKKKLSIVPPKPPVPPYQWALEEYEKLRNGNLWQEGNYKEYYTQLTDILRIYIEKQHHIPAMESTTDQILQDITKVSSNSDLNKKIADLLRMSDLVKFAKEKPLPEDNQKFLDVAVEFVNVTKPQPEPEPEKVEH